MMCGMNLLIYLSMMKDLSTANKLRLRTLSLVVMLASFAGTLHAEAGANAMAAFNRYVTQVESRLQQQHRAGGSMLAPGNDARLRAGEFIHEEITPKGGQELPGALLHHWRGSCFVPGAYARQFEHIFNDYGSYARVYSPQVLRASAQSRGNGQYTALMRIRQHHVLTVVLDMIFDIQLHPVDAQHGYSLSHSTSINEIEAADTASEHALGATQDHGFLWRQYTYWSYEERDGGLYLQLESVSLSRSIPAGLGWAVKPFIESIPQESLQFTLSATANELRREH